MMMHNTSERALTAGVLCCAVLAVGRCYDSAGRLQSLPLQLLQILPSCKVLTDVRGIACSSTSTAESSLGESSARAVVRGLEPGTAHHPRGSRQHQQEQQQQQQQRRRQQQHNGSSLSTSSSPAAALSGSYTYLESRTPAALLLAVSGSGAAWLRLAVCLAVLGWARLCLAVLSGCLPVSV